MLKAYFSVVVKTPCIGAISIKWSKSEEEGRTHGGLDDILSTSRAPWNSSGVALAKDGDGLAVNNELAVLGLDGSLESSVHGIVLEHVDLGKSSSVEFGEPMHGVKRRKRTIYSRSMKGLHKSVEYVNKSASRHSLVDGDNFNIFQLESIAVNNAANAT
jgi:hypothetical protein